MPDIYISNGPQEDKKKKKPVIKKNKAKHSDKHAVPFKKRASFKRNPLLSYSFMPKDVNFETKDDEEKIILLLRAHPITNLKWIFILALMLIAPIALYSFPILEFLPTRFQIVVVLGWYLIALSFFIESFLGWFFNVNIITDERVIDIDFHNMIYKEVSEAKIDQIQDITYKMGGAIRTVFDYGDIYIQTAGEVPNFEFLGIPKPDKVVKVLEELMKEEEIEKIEGRVS